MSASPSPWIIHVTEENFEQEVLAASKQRPVVVDFWAPWCGPCQSLARVLEPLIEERQGGVVLAKVNVDEAQQLAAYFRISAIPAVKAFKDGQLVGEFEGVLPAASLRQFLDDLAPGGTPGLQQARALEDTNPAEAEKAYRLLLEKDAEDDHARLGLARALLAQGKTDQIEEVLAPLSVEGDIGAEADRIKALMSFAALTRGLPDEPGLRQALQAKPEDALTRYQLGCVLARKGDFKGALEMLLSAGERDYKLLTEKVREAMVQVFNVLGSDHELANDYRSRLARLLY